MEKDKNFIVGVFGDHDILLGAVKKVREEGIKIYEVFNPYPVHHLEDALGYKRSKMPVAAFFFGLTGTTCAILMQVLMMGVDWPMIIGGKSFIAVPDFVPVTFEMTVLFAAFGMVGTFLFTRDLKPYKIPRVFDRRSTDDKHIMAIDIADNKKSPEEIKSLLQEVKAEEVYDKEFTNEENSGSFINYVIDLFTNGVTSSSRQLN